MTSRPAFRLRPLACSLLLLAVFCAEPAKAQQANEARYDLLITGGRVLDGTGNPWFPADIGIRGDKIAAIGKLKGATATKVIDARGKYVTPGFLALAPAHTTGATPEA